MDPEHWLRHWPRARRLVRLEGLLHGRAESIERIAKGADIHDRRDHKKKHDKPKRNDKSSYPKGNRNHPEGSVSVWASANPGGAVPDACHRSVQSDDSRCVAVKEIRVSVPFACHASVMTNMTGICQ